jgi:glutathione S-transferase
MLQVYLDPCTVNSRKVLAGLELMGAPYEIRHIDYLAGGHKQPEFLAINPNGALPAAVDGDFALSESNAILQYAADLNRAEAHYPTELKRRADINRWLLWETSTWYPSCYTYFIEYVVKPIMQAPPDEAVIDKEAGNWNRLAAILDARLARSRWLAGDAVTIADIAVAAPMHAHRRQRLPLDRHPNLRGWMAAVEDLPCWRKTQPAVERVLGPL